MSSETSSEDLVTSDTEESDQNTSKQQSAFFSFFLCGKTLISIFSTVTLECFPEGLFGSGSSMECADVCSAFAKLLVTLITVASVRGASLGQMEEPLLLVTVVVVAVGTLCPVAPCLPWRCASSFLSSCFWWKLKAG